LLWFVEKVSAPIFSGQYESCASCSHAKRAEIFFNVCRFYEAPHTFPKI
jgi:hypothetical protein